MYMGFPLCQIDSVSTKLNNLTSFDGYEYKVMLPETSAYDKMYEININSLLLS